MKAKLLLMIPSALLCAAFVWADTGADILRTPLLPKSIALGGADTAGADDVNALQSNPAGLSLARNVELALSHSIGQIDSLEYLAVCNPVKAGGMLGASVIYRHMPDISNTGAVDNPVQSQDLLISLGYAIKLNAFSSSLDGWSAGLNAKWLRSTLGDYTPTTGAADLGLLWVSPEISGLKAGLALQNLGAPIQYINESDPLPLNLKLGAAYAVLDQTENKVTVMADTHIQLTEQTWSVNAGAEYKFMEMGIVRAGYLYQTGTLASTFYGGLGFQYKLDRTLIQVDYAFQPVTYANSDMETQHFISLTLGF